VHEVKEIEKSLLHVEDLHGKKKKKFRNEEKRNEKEDQVQARAFCYRSSISRSCKLKFQL